MNVSLQSGQRPPYVIFETRAVEDRDATIAKGRRIDREVDWVVVRQPGSKDTFEQEAAVWLGTLDKDVNMLPAWVAAYKDEYARWKNGQEPVANGTHINQWPAVNKSQASLILAANLRTVEDLATANEASLARIGIGARELQTKARDFLKVANDTGVAAEELSALRARTTGQEETIKRQAEQLAALTAKVEALAAMAPALREPIPESEPSFL